MLIAIRNRADHFHEMILEVLLKSRRKTKIIKTPIYSGGNILVFHSVSWERFSCAFQNVTVFGS